MEFLMGIFETIILSIACSALFWLLTFRLSRTKIVFSDLIATSLPLGANQSTNRYSYRMVNMGSRDLIEVSAVTQLSFWQKSPNGTLIRNNITLKTEREVIPVLEGRRTSRKESNLHVRRMNISFDDDAIKVLQSVTKKRSLLDKIKSSTLTINDIAQACEGEEHFELRVFVYGNDIVTGARKMFRSPVYSNKSITNKNFASLKQHSKYCCQHPRKLLKYLNVTEK